MFSTAFDSEEQDFKRRKTIFAIVGTIVLHAAILLFLILTLLKTAVPPPEELGSEGMAVNFGFDETGSGDVQALSENPGPMLAASQASNSTPSPANPDHILSSENGDENVIVPKTE